MVLGRRVRRVGCRGIREVRVQQEGEGVGIRMISLMMVGGVRGGLGGEGVGVE